MAWLAVAAIGSAAISATVSGIQMSKAKKAEKEAKRAQAQRQQEIDALKAARKAIPDYSAQFEEMAGQVKNPFKDLGVATKAADMQAEEADIALANTLDTLRATGTGAGGATALAQAAMRSKQGISANIEQQEARNQQLAAQGEQQAQAQKFDLLGKAVQAEQYEQAVNEERLNADLDRAAGLQDREFAQEMASQAAYNQAMAQMGSDLASAAGSYMGAQGQIQAAGAGAPGGGG